MGQVSEPSYPIPANEAARLAELRSYKILNTPAELEYDQVVATVKRVFDVPMATITLVDEDRQWFKSRDGIEACSTDRGISFCTHSIMETRVLVVENALEDPRFAKSPLVVEPPHIRFYAGAPLVTTNGNCLGAVCAIDVFPRRVTERQITMLKTAARLVMKFLDARLVTQQPFKYGQSLTELTKRISA